MNSEVETLGPLRRFTVRGMFGRRPLSIDLAKGAPTLLTGSNGTGKSTILRAIDAVSTGQWLDFARLPLRSLTLYFPKHKLAVTSGDDGIAVELDDQKCRIDLRPLEEATRYGRPDVGPRGVRDASRPRDRSLTIAERERRERQHDRLLAGLVEPWVLELPNRFPVLFITDRRLVVQPRAPRSWSPSGRVRSREMPGDTEDIHAVVREYAADLSDRLRRGLFSYSRRSQALDGRFPKKVVEHMSRKVVVGRQRLEDLRAEVDAKRRSLADFGLLDEASPPRFDEKLLQDAHIRTVVLAFEEDMLNKYSALDDLCRSLRVFVDFLHKHFEGKKVNISPEFGFSIELDSHEQLEPSDLSSGEQHMLVMAYQVLFLSPPGTLVLIDEPELSLHVLWQDQLVDQLAAMGKANDLTFLLATHSPTLVGAREHLKRTLDR